ncbi:hypothetical protein pA_gene0028 [Vibrio phage 13VT501A]|nr:hypothetical protein pA_gene0028 [Vibrio phage 13VT501A]
MSEMKMSDVFNLPVVAKEHCVEISKPRDDGIRVLIPLWVSGFESSHIAHAINNHDRLTEELQAKTDFLALKVAECEKLLEALRLATDTLSLLTEDAIDVSSRVNSEAIKTLVCIDDIIEQDK